MSAGERQEAADEPVGQQAAPEPAAEPVAELLRRGKQAVLDSDHPLARQLLSAVVQREPRNEQGWLWLSGVVDDTSRMRYCLQRVLAINPYNEHAAAALRSMRAAGKPAAEEPPAEQDDGAEPPIMVRAAHRTAHLRRRPSSMVEGEAVREIVAGHGRIAWAYIGLWCGLAGLNSLVHFGGKLLDQPFGAVAGRVALSGLVVAGLLAGAWWAALRVLAMRAPRRALPHAEIYELAGAAAWPSSLVGMAALLAGGIGAVSPQGTSDFFWFIHWALLAAAALLLPRLLISHLVGRELANRRAAQLATAETLAVLALLGGAAVYAGLRISRQLILGA